MERGATIDEGAATVRRLLSVSALVLAEQRNELVELARRNDRSVSAELRQVLRRHLNDSKRQ